MEEQNKLVSFVPADSFGEGKTIRKAWHNDEWHFSVVDIIEVLTDSPIPRNYWSILKKREPQLHTSCMQLKLTASDGRKRMTDCANTEGVLRIVMSVPSPKAEPLKLWLAQVGKERIEETENPELAFERAREIYKAKGYPDDWIGYREKSILIRKELTDEWKNRGITESQEYSILTAEISKATFGVTPSEHAKIKGLEKQNLRDHMTNLELVFTALSEEVTRAITVRDNAQGFNQNQESAIAGGRFAGNARERLETEQRIQVVSTDNFLPTKDKKTNKLPSTKP